MMTWEAAVRWLRSRPEHEQLARDCYFDLPVSRAARRFHESAEWAATRNWLPEQRGRALDLGAGNGIASYALARDGWETFAVEPDPSDEVGAGAVRMVARECGLPMRPVMQRGEQLPFRDRSFDLVYGRQVLHHAADLRQMCREAHRVLRPGGTLVITREHVVSSSRQLSAFLEKHPLHRLYGGESAYTLRAYRESIEGAGFVIGRVYRAFDTEVNMAPYTSTMLRDELQRRVRALPGVGAMASPLIARSTFPMVLRVLSRVDLRPGRLVSFVARKRAA